MTKKKLSINLDWFKSKYENLLSQQKRFSSIKLPLILYRDQLYLLNIINGPKPIIDQVYSLSFDSSYYKDGKLENVDLFASHVKGFFQDYKIKSKKITLISDQTEILTRVMTIPIMAPNDIHLYIKQQLKNYTIFSGSEIRFNWQILAKSDINGEEHYRILVIACKISIFSSWSTALQMAGLSLEGMSSYSTALIQLFQNNQTMGSQALFCVEPYQVIMIIWVNNQLHTIQRHLAKTKGDHSVESIVEAIHDIYHKNKQSIEELPTYLLAPYLEAPVLNQCLEQLDFPLFPKFSKETLNKSVDFQHISDEVIALNLPAIGVLQPNGKDLQILKKESLPPYFTMLVRYYLILLTCISVLMLLLFFGFHIHTQTLETEIQGVKQQLSTTNKQYTVVKSIETDMALKKRLIIYRRKLAQNSQSITAHAILFELSSLIPNRVRVAGISMKDNDIIEFKGLSKSSNDVFAFIDDLKLSPLFQSPELKEVYQDKRDSLFHFDIQAQLGANYEN